MAGVSFSVGDLVRILSTTNVMLRYPNLIGSVGRVKETPVHPNTWFTVNVIDGRSVKFQPTALSAVDESEVGDEEVPPPIYDSKGNQKGQHKGGKGAPGQDKVPDSDGTDADGGSPTSGGDRGGAGASHAQSLHKGSRVMIHRTENVSQRAPQLIGQTGIVTEVPQHPNTWFKVQFEDGKIYTFRPSALRLATKADAKALQTKRAAQAKDFGETTLLSSIDADTWVNQTVRIKGGRFAGYTGRVLRSGNGWVQLATSMGEVAKRAYELQLLPEGADAEGSSDETAGGPPRKRSKPDRPALLDPLTGEEDKDAMEISPSEYEQEALQALDADQESSSQTRSSSRRPPVAPKAPENRVSTRRGRSSSFDAASNPAPKADKEKSSSQSSQAAASQRRTRGGARSGQSSGPGSGSEMERVGVNTRNRESRRGGSGDSQRSAAASRIAESRQALERYQDHIRKQLEKQMEKTKERPNLNFWLKELRAANRHELLPGPLDDEAPVVYDEETVGLPTCKGCGSTIARGLTYCWNETCVESPIYKAFLLAAQDHEAAPDRPRAPLPGPDESGGDEDMHKFVLHAPAKWLDARRRRLGRKGDADDDAQFTKDSLVYRWQCSMAATESPPEADTADASAATPSVTTA